MIAPDQVLTVAQMVAAEQRLMDAGTDVHELMQRAGRGAAEYVRRMAAGAPVTVLCGPGNNGGDGYVVAEALREAGGPVVVVSAMPPKTDAARRAADLYQGPVVDADEARGAILVDCLFGSGLNRELSKQLGDLLDGLSQRHDRAVAVDLPSGIDADSGALLAETLPHYALCIALGAWKRAHFLMPAMAQCDEHRLVDIGAAREDGGAVLIGKPALSPPAADAHKYRRGLVSIVAGEMAGAARLSAHAAAYSGAGYVQMLQRDGRPAPDWLVATEVTDGNVAGALDDARIGTVLIGPGLGRDDDARARFDGAIRAGHRAVLDADALTMLRRPLEFPAILTPHEGELRALEKAFDLDGNGAKPDRALALAKAARAVVIAKGPDTVIAAPDGRLAFAPRASSWLSVAGSGDVLAGIVASRLAVTREPWRAACEAAWMHGEAACLAGPAFTAEDLADNVRGALAACL